MPHVGRFYVVGDGIADDTLALQSALNESSTNGPLRIPAGTYNIASGPLNIPNSGTTIVGAGRAIATITTSTPDQDLITLGAGVNKLSIEDVTFSNTSSAGHIFTPLGAVNTTVFESVGVIQNNPAKSIWNGGDFGYLDNLWVGCTLSHNGATSVPSFNIVTTTKGANSNTWQRCQCNHEAAGALPFFNIESDSASIYNYANSWRDCTFEVCNGGCIRLLTANECVVDNCNVFDLTTTTDNLFFVGAGSGGLASRDIAIRGVHRNGGTIGGGKFDIALQAGGKAVTTTIQDCNQSSGAGFQVDLQTNQRAVIIGCDNITLTNQHQSTILIDRGRLVAETVQVFVKAGTPADGDFNVTPGNGSFAVDSTANKIWVRIGGVWKGVVVS